MNPLSTKGFAIYYLKLTLSSALHNYIHCLQQCFLQDSLVVLGHRTRSSEGNKKIGPGIDLGSSTKVLTKSLDISRQGPKLSQVERADIPAILLQLAYKELWHRKIRGQEHICNSRTTLGLLMIFTPSRIINSGFSSKLTYRIFL